MAVGTGRVAVTPAPASLIGAPSARVGIESRRLFRIAAVFRFLHASRAKQGRGGRRSLISVGLGHHKNGRLHKKETVT